MKKSKAIALMLVGMIAYAYVGASSVVKPPGQPIASEMIVAPSYEAAAIEFRIEPISISGYVIENYGYIEMVLATGTASKNCNECKPHIGCEAISFRDVRLNIPLRMIWQCEPQKSLT